MLSPLEDDGMVQLTHASNSKQWMNRKTGGAGERKDKAAASSSSGQYSLFFVRLQFFKDTQLT